MTLGVSLLVAMGLAFLPQQPASLETHPYASGSYASMMSGINRATLVNLPLKQIDKKENWRRVIDFKNNSGWIHWSQLKKINSIIPTKDKILFENPTNFSKPLAKIKSGRVLIVQKCNGIWCKINTDDFEGWIKTDNIWGVLD